MQPDNRDKLGRFIQKESSIASDMKRFHNKIEFTGKCWLWRGALSKGYGKFSYKGKATEAHRYAYELFIDDIPQGLVIDHLCRVTNCVNPWHLEPVTSLENIRRGAGWSLHVQKDICKNGHEFTPDNTSITTNNRRVCKTCHRISSRAYDRRRRLLV